jgi:hypothetical protein
MAPTTARMPITTIIAINVGFKELVELFVPTDSGDEEVNGELVGELPELGYGVIKGAVPCRIGPRAWMSSE